jgi:hypothetical protein
MGICRGEIAMAKIQHVLCPQLLPITGNECQNGIIKTLMQRIHLHHKRWTDLTPRGVAIGEVDQHHLTPRRIFMVVAADRVRYRRPSRDHPTLRVSPLE